MRWAIWYHLYNLKNVESTHGGVLILVKLQASPCNLLKLTILHGCFSRFLNFTNDTKSCNAPHLPTLWSIEALEMHVEDFSTYNHFIIFNFLWMNNILMTLEMYVKFRVNVIKLDVQCDHRLLIHFLSDCIRYWSIKLLRNFLSIYFMYLTSLMKTLRYLLIALRSCRPSFP